MEIKREVKTKTPQIAVIFSGGKQYKVSEGQEILIEKLPEKEKSKLNFTDLLGQKKITAVVLKHQKSPKIKILKFKSKTRYKRLKGHRQLKTKIKILKIA